METDKERLSAIPSRSAARPTACATANIWWIVCVLVLGIGFRFVGLSHSLPSHDEEHYRGDMSVMAKTILDHRFRHHSEWHVKGAPHGLLSPFVSFAVGKSLNLVFNRWLPEPGYARDNFAARFAFALLSSLTIILLMAFAFDLFGPSAVVPVGLIAAVSPLLIRWGRSEYLDTVLTLFQVGAFYALWKLLNVRSSRSALIWAATSGVLMGLSLGTKWPAAFVAPILPATYVLVRLSPLGGRMSTRDWLHIATLLFAFTIVSLGCLSIGSFKWVFFPNPTNAFGDMQQGVVPLLQQGIWNTFTVNSLLGVLLHWGGPLFAMVFIFAFRWSLSTDWYMRQRNVFVFLLMVSAIIFTVLQEGIWNSWRTTYAVAVFILATGHFFERVSSRERNVWTAAIFLTALPLSLYSGLRLGPPLIPFYGEEHTFFEEQPPLPRELQIFPRRP